MRFVGNFLWFIFCGGLLNCILWLLAAVVFAITIIGLPFSRSAFEIAKMSAFPFGKDAVHVRDKWTNSYGFCIHSGRHQWYIAQKLMV